MILILFYYIISFYFNTLNNIYNYILYNYIFDINIIVI